MHVDDIQTGADGVLAAIAGSAASTGLGMAVGGIAAVLVISAIFYAVGRGEDRDRAQAASEGGAEPVEERDAGTTDDAPRLRPAPRPRARRRR
jgi:hypothetical protein